jgi:predicted amidohydrolase YtcJ
LLALGKLADFIVVDRDVLRVPTDELKDVEVCRVGLAADL